MAHEHEWPASQSVTTAGGRHKFVTLQNQSTRPTLAGTQVGAVYTKTIGAGLQELFFEDEAGNELQLTSGTSLNAAFASTSASDTTQRASSNTNYADVSGLSVSLTAVAGPIMVSFCGALGYTGGGVGAGGFIAICDGSNNVLAETIYDQNNSGDRYVPASLSYVVNTASGAYTYKMRFKGTGGLNCVLVNAVVTARIFALYRT